ncbi:hypothetical protein [Parasitella parasitica]|uniref:Uncharacterized protein n=1 Tax=Parasitella parasitica TaxID=35722 RepID=A0A0B7N346_9FUNG|nr:hypothetical protein [Parasitella parasitica]
MDSVVLYISDYTDIAVNTCPNQDTCEYGGCDRNTIFGNYLTAKGYKIIYENVLFIAFEVWRLWTLTDGIVHLNSLTILASAWFSVFSSVFNVLLVIESNKWITSKFEVLKIENKNLQIALSTTLFLLSVPVIISAHKTAKIVGWQVYKKIGSSIELQNMYQNVQCLVGLFEYSAADLWFTGIVYEFASIICIIITVYLAFRCQINFDKGLKPFVFWIPFQGTAKFIEEPSHHAVEAGLLGVKDNNDRLPIDDEEDDFYNDSTLTENKKEHILNGEPIQIPRKSMERVNKLKMERYHIGNVKSDLIKLGSNTTQPDRVAMKPLPKNNETNITIATITTPINSNKPWRSEISPVTDNNLEAPFSIILDSGTTEPTIMGRVMHPISSSKAYNSSKTAIISKATSTTTKIYP